MERLIGKVAIDGNITLELWDKSRVLAGDRYYVCLEARGGIPFTMEDLNGIQDSEKVYKVLRELYGEHIPYVYVQERHFIAEGEKEKVMDGFLENFYKNKLPYMRNPAFRRGAIHAKIRELKQKRPQLFFS